MPKRSHLNTKVSYIHIPRRTLQTFKTHSKQSRLHKIIDPKALFMLVYADITSPKTKALYEKKSCFNRITLDISSVHSS
jgi:hypothetical protein